MGENENKILMMVDQVLDINFAQLKQVEVFIISSKQELPQLRRKVMEEIQIDSGINGAKDNQHERSVQGVILMRNYEQILMIPCHQVELAQLVQCLQPFVIQGQPL